MQREAHPASSNATTRTRNRVAASSNRFAGPNNRLAGSNNDIADPSNEPADPSNRPALPRNGVSASSNDLTDASNGLNPVKSPTKSWNFKKNALDFTPDRFNFSYDSKGSFEQNGIKMNLELTNQLKMVGACIAVANDDN